MHKNKGFIPILIIIIGLLTMVGGAYYFSNEKTEEKVESNLDIINKTEDKPVIESISRTSGPVGTNLDLKGYHLLDNRGDQNLIIENSDGETASLGFGNPEHLNLSEKYASMRFTLEEKVCKDWGSDKAGPCSSGWMNIAPGEYKIYVAQGGFTKTISNKVTFTVTD